MNYQLFVFCPDDDSVIEKIIAAASDAGAGVIGNYSQCAFVSRGESRWKTEKGAHPTIGAVGRVSKIKGAKIEMICPGEKMKAIDQAIRKIHPYEEPDIQFVQLEE